MINTCKKSKEKGVYVLVLDFIKDLLGIA